MPDVNQHVDNSSSTHELELIHQKKLALQRLVKLTTSLNNLSQGLETALIIGKPSKSIPRSIIDGFKAMTQKLSPLPTKKLQNSLTATQIKLQSDIRHVLQLSQKQENELDELIQCNKPGSLKTLEESFTRYVDDFKKKGQASIALRIVLAGRNAVSSLFKLPVPENFVKQQIKTLNKRETKFKKRIKNELSHLFKEITVLIESNVLPDALLSQLHNTRGQIINNINHINAGKNIEEMPIMFETIEVSTDNLPVDTTGQRDKVPAPVPEPVDEVMAEIEEIEIKPVKRSLSIRMKDILKPKKPS